MGAVVSLGSDDALLQDDYGSGGKNGRTKKQAKKKRPTSHAHSSPEGTMGFKSVQAGIAKKEGIPKKNAGAILASASRNASPAAKKANPNLTKVKGAADPAPSSSGPHQRAGKITAIRDHGDGKHASISVTHGKKKKDSSGEMVGYHRASSDVTIPKAHASNYTIGQRVNVGISPADNDGDDDAPPSSPAPKKKSAPPAKKSGAKKSGKAPVSAVRQAMSGYKSGANC